jgi:hypothetical protein
MPGGANQSTGQPIELSLKQFMDILNTCLFIHANIKIEVEECREMAMICSDYFNPSAFR